MQSLQEQPRMGWLVALILLNTQSRSLAETNPHQPYKQTWILTDGETHTTLNETTRTAPTGTGGQSFNSALETSILPTSLLPRSQPDVMVFMLVPATKRTRTVGGYNTRSVSHGHVSHPTMVNGSGGYQNQT
jgi:hypothetical protein